MPKDKYASLSALKAELKAHVDYRLRLLNRNSWATIIAPHGGFIDAGSSAIARSVAGRNYNLYDFQGLRKQNSAELHITSTRFRDPSLNRLLQKSVTAIAIHWMGSCNEAVIWLGGLNKNLKEISLSKLISAGFKVNPDSPYYRGESKDNIVNFPEKCGIQLEISDELMQEFFGGPRFLESGYKPQTKNKFDHLVAALRKSLRAYKKQ
ncbi:MAG: poly-gamma-glutamate hydrolase family protein [Candidatus Obscuribacterales bacterium]|nr:poly-gamma-glutamate hydrolase family protein [Candidatus Obscuribacterales bacterium]